MIRYIAFIIAVFMSWNVAFAQTSDVYEGETATFELTSEVSSVAAGDIFWLALTIKPESDDFQYKWGKRTIEFDGLKFKWHSRYGYSFGDSKYPEPNSIIINGEQSFGYNGIITILIPVTTNDDYSEDKVPLKLYIENEMCPRQFTYACKSLNLTIDIGETAYTDEHEQLFSDARSKLPEMSWWAAEMQSDNDEMQLLVHMSTEEMANIKSIAFFPYGNDVLTTGAEQSFSNEDDGLLIRSARDPMAPMASNLNGVLSITYKSGEVNSFELNVLPSSTLKTMRPMKAIDMSILELIIYALIGGLILNLMPCVFPILSLKALALMRSQENHHKEGWAYTFGILVSFLAIALTIISLRAGGETVGWGFQLQEPTFVALMVFVLVAVGLSLSGLYTIRLGIEGAGHSLTESKGSKGSFFTGVLAALVATPCTAPFMAPALAFAIMQPLHITLIGFLALGFGLALPFLLLSYVPKLSDYLPKPGPWMEKLKEGLAFPMYATAAWLLWVFTNQAGSASALMLMIGLIIFAFAIWLWQQSSSRRIHGLSLIILIIAGYVAMPSANEPSENDILNGEPFSEMRLQELRNDSRRTFVYFSADWCITCKVNERISLFTDANRELAIERNIAILKGDWTNRNEKIAKVLESYNRMGVPLYLYFPSGAKEAIVLPEILTPNSITDLFKEK